MMKQQDQTLKYFRSVVQEWNDKSETQDYNAGQGRHNAVLDAIDRHGNVKHFLDVGCGTGQLTLEVAGKGIEAVGNDFAQGMIDQCEANREKAQVPATFIGGSFFDADFGTALFDLISAQGFIEYISIAEMQMFFQRSYEMLSPGGVLAVGSRNRLFNVFSLNSFTEMEETLGTLNILIKESQILRNAETQEAALEGIRHLERTDPQPSKHPATGIGVDTRYQFAPAELLSHLRRIGFKPELIYPVHYHGLPSGVKQEQLALHTSLARTIGEFGLRDHRLLPFCSTYVMCVKKPVS